jgi:hypothetical protein
MATVKFNSIVTELFQRLKDPITQANANGSIYTNALVCYHLNRSIRDFLIEKIVTLKKDFPEVFPEYIKIGSQIALTSGSVPKPSDCFTVLDLNVPSGVKFTKVDQFRVNDIINGFEPVIIPSASNPIFWEEGANIKTYGLTSGNVIPRYIVLHNDISPLVSVLGNWNTVSGTYTAATQTLAATMYYALSAANINNPVMFRSATASYQGIVASAPSAGSVILRGDGLPTTDIATVVQILMSTTIPDSSDLYLSPYWYGEIVERAIQYILQDTQSISLK